MIRYALVCDQGHSFESWFPEFRRLRQAGEAVAGDLSGLRLGESRKGDHGAKPGVRRDARRGRPATAARSIARAAQSAPPPLQPAPMPPIPPKTSVAMLSPPERELRQKLKELRDHITKNASYVGPRFPEEARKIHYGETEHRSIYGEASPEEAKELHEEGIEFHPLPILPDDKN